jgi:hypothetical protein
MCRLDRKAVADMRKDQTAMAEDVFNVNSCSYGTRYQHHLR